MEDDKTDNEERISESAPASSRWFGSLDLEKAKALASNLECQFQQLQFPPAQAASAETVREFVESLALELLQSSN